MSKYQVIIPNDTYPYPYDFEISAAIMLANYFQQNVEFIPRAIMTTPDVKIGAILWEIKSPTGKGKRNIQHQFNRGMKQSDNIVFDARRSKIDIRKIRRELARQASLTKSLKRLILITKDAKIEVVK